MGTTVHVDRKKAWFFFDHAYYLVVVLSTGEFLELLEIPNVSSLFQALNPVEWDPPQLNKLRIQQGKHSIGQAVGGPTHLTSHNWVG